MLIKSLKAVEILDSRGKPTIRTFVTLEDGSVHSSSVPSGASTGSHEAVELRDKQEKRYQGFGVSFAVSNVNIILNNALTSLSIIDPRLIDKKMIEIDGTANKSNLGANAILSVSQAVLKATAYINKLPLWQYVNQYYFPNTRPTFPKLMLNVINGGKHANWNFDIQEFMIIPNIEKASEALRIGSEIFFSIGKRLKSRGLETLVGDEGGYSPHLKSNDEAFQLIIDAAGDIGYVNERDYKLAIDAAASEIYYDGKYIFKKDNKEVTGEELINYYLKLKNTYRVFSYEDVFAEDDWENFVKITSMANENNLLVVGDDLYCTNVKRIQTGIEKKASNAVLIKPNQIGTVSETADAINMTRNAGWKVVISHRSGETEDSFIADLAYGAGAEFLKAGSVCRSERLAKYNRLVEIESKL